MGGVQDFLRRVFAKRLVWYALAWTLTLFVAYVCLYAAWHSFDNYYTRGHRNDGNGGHVTIDFGGQYLMGRLLVDGHGRDLYNRSEQRLALTAAYPVEDQEPDAKRSDAENLMFWMMGSDDPAAPEAFGSFLVPLAAADGPGAVVLFAAAQQEWTPERLDHARDRKEGGPLYPPINAFLNAPLALLPVHTAYRVQEVNNLVLAFVAGLGISVITRRGVWWPVATLLIIFFPGFIGSLNLGQNATLTLAILVWGWALMARTSAGWGGLVWGLLAFKPVWAMVFFLVLVLTRRWRDCLTMLAMGAALGLLTLPFVGVQSWRDWLKVGHEAAILYNTDRNWIWLSRDVLSMPRRWLLVFEDGSGKELVRQANPTGPSFWWYLLCGGGDVPGWLVPSLAGWALLVGFLEMTVRLAVVRKEQARAVTGPPAAFLLLGAWLCCYHFMYYDVLLAALPVLLLFADPGRYFEPLYLTNVPLGRVTGGAAAARWCHPEGALTGRFGVAWVALLLAAFPRAVLLLTLSLAVVGGGLPWPLLVPAAVEGAPSLLAFAYVSAVVVARLVRPLLPPPQYRSIVVLNRIVPTLVLLLLLTQPLFPALRLGSYYGPPWDTWILMALWLWAGWRWLRQPAPAAPRKEAQPAAKTTGLRLALTR
jgi:arabinofuranan 3-O-arabinosyltransferase